MGNSCCSSESTSSSEDTPYHVRKIFTFSEKEIMQYNFSYNKNNIKRKESI